MKKQATWILAIILTLSLCAGALAQEGAIQSEADLEGKRIGTCNFIDYPEEQFLADFSELSGVTPKSITYFDTKVMELLALETGRIDCLRVLDFEGEYFKMISGDAYYTVPADKATAPGYACMVVRTDDTQLRDLLNDALAQIKESGKLDELVKENIADVKSPDDFASIELPTFEGKPTYNVLMRGSTLPLDFVNASGEPAGFNVALMAEIGRIAQVNFVPVYVDNTSSQLSLNSGRVDVVFCITAEFWEDASSFGFLCTDYYYTFDRWVYLCKR